MRIQRRDPMIGHVRYLSSELLGGAVEILIHLKRIDGIRPAAVRESRAALIAYLASAHARNLEGLSYQWPISEVGRMVLRGIGHDGAPHGVSYADVHDAIYPHLRVLRRFERADQALTEPELHAAARFLQGFADAVQAREASYVRGRGGARRLAA